MDVKIGYYPLLDTALAIRQIFSIERFKPFCSALELIDGKLTLEERFNIHKVAKFTGDWLQVIELLIVETSKGVASPEELLNKAANDPELLFGKGGTSDMVDLLSDIWQDYCFAEMSKVNRRISDKVKEMGNNTSEEIVDYILTQTDRIERVKGDVLKFHIKPDFSVKISDIEQIIIMPSVFSSRNVSFWYHDKTFLFYVALDSRSMALEEPSDMLLLRTLAFNDKTRLKMLKLLTESAKSVNDIAEELGVNASTASRHFKVFKDVGLVDIQSQEGNSIYYSLNQKELNKALTSISNYVMGRKAQYDQD